jgi:uncharacterized membrane protein
MRSLKFICLILAFMLSLIPSFSRGAAEPLTDQTEVVKAEVVHVLESRSENLGGTNTKYIVQSIEARILEGLNKDKSVVLDNEYTPLRVGDIFYLSYTTTPEGENFYNVYDPYRIPVLVFFTVLFIILVLVFGGIQGLRGLLSLFGSLFVITFLLLPGILKGISPIAVSIGVSSIIIILGSYITHGFNKTTSTAVFGMIVTVVITGIMALVAVNQSHLSGFSSEEAMFLNLNLHGDIDLLGVLLGGIMIGLLGVLYDVAIGQAISVEELHTIAPHVSRWKIYKRAIRIGREHIGALVNTLAIAYVGASLPLLLLFYSSAKENLTLILNQEVFATEIIRILIGSIGLVLAVPITTLISTLVLIKKDNNVSTEVLKEEEKALKDFEHK